MPDGKFKQVGRESGLPVDMENVANATLGDFGNLLSGDRVDDADAVVSFIRHQQQPTLRRFRRRLGPYKEGEQCYETER